MKIAAMVARYLLGLVFLVFGLNGFLHFIPQGPMPNGLPLQFIQALMQSHYILIVAAIEVIGAVLLLANRYVALALTLLGPVVVNILLFHFFLLPMGLGIGLFVAVLWLVVFAYVRPAFAGIFQSQIQN